MKKINSRDPSDLYFAFIMENMKCRKSRRPLRFNLL